MNIRDKERNQNADINNTNKAGCISGKKTRLITYTTGRLNPAT